MAWYGGRMCIRRAVLGGLSWWMDDVLICSAVDVKQVRIRDRDGRKEYSSL